MRRRPVLVIIMMMNAAKLNNIACLYENIAISTWVEIQQNILLISFDSLGSHPLPRDSTVFSCSDKYYTLFDLMMAGKHYLTRNSFLSLNSSTNNNNHKKLLTIQIDDYSIHSARIEGVSDDGYLFGLLGVVVVMSSASFQLKMLFYMATGGIPLAKLEPQTASSSRNVIPVPFSKLLAIEMKARGTGVGKRAVNPNYTTTTSQLDGGESKKKYKNDSHSGESVECKKGSGCQPSVHKEAAAGVVWQKENHHPTRDDK